MNGCKRFKNILFFLAGVLFLFSACQEGGRSRQKMSAWMAPNGRLKVLSTTSIIDDLVKEIGQEQVDSLALITAGLDPHSYQLVKGDDEKLLHADLIFYNGLKLEHGPSLKTYLEREAKAHSLGDLLYAQRPDLILTENGVFDPHIWMDVSLWLQVVPFIVKELSEKDPSHRQEFVERGKALLQKMEASHGAIEQQLLSIPSEKRYLVTSHDAFNYFSRAYLASPKERQEGTWHERFQAPEGLAPESQLSAHDIQRILDHLLRHQITVLFPESNVSRDSIKKIQDAAGKKGLMLTIASEPLYGDSMGAAGSDGDTYLKMMEHNSRLIARYLKNSDPKEEVL
ncbi:MAG: ABC-type transporter, substrate-binding lipoprotein [Chlamydiales bacterium]|jgi:manganese/zinc/iron transport system substrate-binding protein|nr:ABC-type transporter, substrate-binding lipoprotein [Chlamydiales bacterium]